MADMAHIGRIDVKLSTRSSLPLPYWTWTDTFPCSLGSGNRRLCGRRHTHSVSFFGTRRRSAGAVV
jgi:hypothetical protein